MNIRLRRRRDGTLRSPNYYYRFTYEGREYEGLTGTTDAKLARKILTKEYTLVVEGRRLDKVKKKRPPKLGSYSAAYLDGYALNKKSRAGDESIIRRSLTPTFGSKRLDEITSAAVEQWRNERLAETRQGTGRRLAPATVMNEMACFKTIMGLAVRDGHIVKNPVSGVKMPRVNNRRDRVISEDEYNRLIKAVSDTDAPHMRPILVLAYETGMRRGEILGLRWSDLSRGLSSLRLAETKNGTSRMVPLNQAAREALRAWPRRTDTDYLFARPDGRPLKDCGRAWRTLCSATELTDIRFHDFRHAFTTRMLEARVDIRSIMAITGHKSMIMFQRYSHPTLTHLQNAVESLNDDSTWVNLGTPMLVLKGESL